MIGAGRSKTVDGLGGANNISVIVEGLGNTNQAGRSVIVGGQQNVIGTNSRSSTISGGEYNQIQAMNPSNGAVQAAGIGGGVSNLVGSNGMYATIVGGCDNWAIDFGTTISGGYSNSVGGRCATIGGGRQNVVGVLGDSATIGGGFDNQATQAYATVPGSTRARATNFGSFVWSGDSGFDTTSFGNNTFTVRCAGGARFYTAGGTNTGVRLAALGTQWESLSDRNAKTDFEPVNKREILAEVVAMPVSSWHYKHDLSRRCIGPVAQDFHAAFGLGSDDKTIGTLDSDGVMCAAIQGLVEELKERDKAIEELKTEVRTLRRQFQSALPPAGQ